MPVICTPGKSPGFLTLGYPPTEPWWTPLQKVLTPGLEWDNGTRPLAPLYPELTLPPGAFLSLI